MTTKTINVLHIEDDKVQRMRLAHHLGAIKEFQFTITCVESEEDAVKAFSRGGTDLVILDYQLTQGNGLSCLHKLRGQDAIVPIVAVSGVASAETAADLLHAGADDYFDKHELDRQALARSVRHVLARTDAMRQGSLAPASESVARIEAGFRELCSTFRTRLGPDFFRQLDELETAAREAIFTPAKLQDLVDRVYPEQDAMNVSFRMELRPLLSEIFMRLFGTGPARSV